MNETEVWRNLTAVYLKLLQTWRHLPISRSVLLLNLIGKTRQMDGKLTNSLV
jgi:hypothetical protein